MCDTLVVVGDGGVLFAKNSDRDPNEAQILEWHPAAVHPPGTTLRCTWIDIPQATATHATLISRPFWMWGAEMGANQHGVVIGNEAVFTKEPYAATGLTGMDLLRLALERATTAEHAVSVITGLLDRHGQGGGCGHEKRSFTYHNSFLIADPTTAYVLETAGRHWATEQVTEGVRSISNGLTIPGFAQKHSDRLKTTVSACRTRRTLTEATPAGAGPADLMTALRSHGPGPWPRYSPVNGGMAAPCMHAGGLITASQTTASWVADLTTGSSSGSGGDALHWVTGTAAPCTSLFKPVRVGTPLDLGPDPSDQADDRTLWWRHERLHRTAMRDPEKAFARFAADRDATERRWLAEPPGSATAFAEADTLLQEWTHAVTTAVTTDRRPWYVRRYWAARDAAASMISPSPGRPDATTRGGPPRRDHTR